MSREIESLTFAALVVVALLAVGYLVACAGAGRWLSLKEWL